MAAINLNVNGKKQTVEVDPKTPMLWVLRDHLNLVGTKFGCGIAQCGACTILLDGSSTRACQLPVSAAEGKRLQPLKDFPKTEIIRCKKHGWNMMFRNVAIARPVKL